MEKKTTDISEIHRVQLKMLKAVVVLFEKYNLRYSIYCGTLLGAVRHKGFIPWDDDIDLAMPLKDYRRFLRHVDELPSEFICEHRGNTRDFANLWMKIKANNTTFIQTEYIGTNVHHGLSLDIYPMIGTPKMFLLKKVQSWLLFIVSKLQAAAYYGCMQNPGYARWIIAHIPFLIRKNVIDVIMWLSAIDPEKSEYIGSIDLAPFVGKYRRIDWQEMTKLTFEDACYQAPVQYDKILRTIYGDYMKLPPEEARTGHYKEGMIVDMHRDYRLYRKELLEK